MKHLSKLLILTILCTILIEAKADNEIKLKNIKGTATGGIHATPAFVIEQAIKNAKLNALTRAGIAEEITAYQNLFKNETNNNYEEVFTSDIFTNVSGVVTDVSITDTLAQFDSKTMTLRIEVTLDAKVIKYSEKEDQTFDAWVEGVKSFYNNHEVLKLTIKPTKQCYARIFMIAKEQESYILYPNDYESDNTLMQNTPQHFPTIDIDYILETNLSSEPHRLIIVLLKEPIQYTNKVAYKPILDWIMRISPEKRVVKTLSFTVVKN